MLKELFLNKKKYLYFFWINIIFVSIFYFFIFQGGPLGYWDTYVIAPARFLINEKIIFLNNKGHYQYKGYKLTGKLPDNLVNKKYYGIITKDQRLGAGVIYSYALLLFGASGIIIYFILIRIILFIFSYFFGAIYFKNIYYAYIFAWLSTFNTFFITIKRVNPTTLAYVLIFIIMFFMFKKSKNWILIGFLFGAMINIRNILVLMAPAIILFILLYEDKKKLFKIFIFCLTVTIITLPYLYWHSYAFGKPLVHSSQYKDFKGFRPTFEHSIFGHKFIFNGLLNYPFHNKLVRTPHFPFPMYLCIPLITLRTFGYLLTALFIIGIIYIKKKELLFWISMFSPAFLIMLPMENWDELKTTYILLYFPIIILLIIKGINSFKLNLDWNISYCIMISLCIYGFSTFLLNIYIPIDERWYVRFPKSKLSNEILGNEERREWYFFHRQEFFEEEEFQREKFTDIKFYPVPYFPIKFYKKKLCPNIPVIVDVWSNIYGK